MNFNFPQSYIFDNVAKKTLLSIFALLNFIFFCPGETLAQLDPAFGTNGVVRTNISGYPIASFVLPDGKILVINFSYSPNRHTFARFNSDGTTDNTYGTNGVVTPVMPFLNSESGVIYTAVRQADGKIVLAGVDNSHGIITRFNENGTLDTGFANNGVHRTNLGIWRDYFLSLTLLPDGKILGAGPTSAFQNNEIFLIRYNPNGTLDQTFGNGNGYIKHVDETSDTNITEVKMLRQSDGKLLIFRKLSRNPITRIRRFNADGNLDNTYPDIILNNRNIFSTVALQSDDKLLVAGYFDNNDSLNRFQKDVSIARYTTSGTPDASFGTNGISDFDLTSNFFDDIPTSLRVMPDGEILVGALTRVPLNRSSVKGNMLSLARLSANGKAVTGKFIQTFVSKLDSYSPNEKGDSLLTIQPDGKILTAFFWRNENYSVALLLTRVVEVPIQKYKFKGLPFDFYYDQFDAKATAEVTVFRPSSHQWYFNYSSNYLYGFSFGLSDDILVPSDYIGDFQTEQAVFRPSNGFWYIAKNKFNAATNFIAVHWGQTGDIPAPADFDADGKTDLAVFRPSDGVWYIRSIADNSWRAVKWGTNGDKPVAGDYDGDGFDDVAIWRPSNGLWCILRSSDGKASFVNFGVQGDIPVQEDYDGDGITDIAVWRPSSGIWCVLKSSDGNISYFYWGNSTDMAVPADYDGDLKTDIAVFRPSMSRWYIYRSSDNSYTESYWGLSTDVPVQNKN